MKKPLVISFEKKGGGERRKKKKKKRHLVTSGKTNDDLSGMAPTPASSVFRERDRKTSFFVAATHNSCRAENKIDDRERKIVMAQVENERLTVF